MILLLFLLLQDLATLSNEGAAAMRAGRYADAVRVYRSLIANDSANPMWRMNLGMALAYTGRHREAAAEFGAFLKARPEPGPAHLMLGLSLLKLGEHCAAIEPLEAALRWPGKPNSAWVELGMRSTAASAGSRRRSPMPRPRGSTPATSGWPANWPAAGGWLDAMKKPGRRTRHWSRGFAASQSSSSSTATRSCAWRVPKRRCRGSKKPSPQLQACSPPEARWVGR